MSQLFFKWCDEPTFLNDVMSQPEGRQNQHGCALGSSDSKYFFCNTCMFFFLCFEASLNLHFSFNETYFLQSDKQTNIMRSTWDISQCFLLLFSFFLLPYTCISIMCRNASTQQHYFTVLCLFSLTFFFSGPFIFENSVLLNSVLFSRLPWTCWNEGQLIEQIGQWWLF